MSGQDGRPARLTAAASRAPASGPRGRWTDGLLLGAAGVIGFSGTVPATRVAAPVFGPVTLTFARIVIAAVLGTVTLAVGGRLRLPGRRHLAGLLAMGLGLAVGYPLFLALAVQKVPAIHAAVVIALVPAATAVLSAARNSERLPRPFWLACLTGLVAVTGYAAVSGGGSAGTSDLWLAAAVLSCAVGYVEGARVSPAHRSDPRAVLGDAPASPGSSPAAGRRSADPPRDPDSRHCVGRARLPRRHQHVRRIAGLVPGAGGRRHRPDRPHACAAHPRTAIPPGAPRPTATI